LKVYERARWPFFIESGLKASERHSGPLPEVALRIASVGDLIHEVTRASIRSDVRVILIGFIDAEISDREYSVEIREVGMPSEVVK
jgi:hypothetical protein